MITIKILFVIFIGFSGGIAVGAGFVAFLTVLGVIPRLTQLTKTIRYIRGYEWGVVSGVLFATCVGLWDINFELPKFILIPIGLACGIFVGMLAAALTEVLNVFPILARRIGVAEKIVILLMAVVFGKVLGSLFHWVLFVNYSL